MTTRNQVRAFDEVSLKDFFSKQLMEKTTVMKHIRGIAAAVYKGVTSHTYKLREYSAVIALFLLFGLFLAHKQDISIADVGRHIRNGEFFFKDPQVLRTNYYSYTEPKFPVLNHHWGTGVLFYLVWRVTGFEGLHVFYAALYLLSFGTFFWIAKKQSGLVAAGLSAILMIPILALRTEIRPEGFTYLCVALFFWLLIDWRERKEKFKYLLILLPVMEVFWVNLHIYFILGPMIVGVFWLDSIFCRRENARKLFLLLALTSFATLINPFGFQGALAPFTIFQNYGISIAENYPVWYIDHFFGVFAYDTLYFKIVSALLAVSFIMAAFKRAREIPLPYVLFAVGFSGMAWFAIRNMALFGLFSIPIMAINISIAFDKAKDGWVRIFLPSIYLLLVAAIVLFSNGMLSAIFRLSPETGFGMATGNSAAAEFIIENRLRGPIFNNYDAGGYLIYYLFPDESVFVDNRPEAYSEVFFEQVYKPMQMSDEKWNEIDSLVGFQTIIVARREDMGISSFLKARSNDPQWRCVFSDPFFLIFIRR